MNNKIVIFFSLFVLFIFPSNVIAENNNDKTQVFETGHSYDGRIFLSNTEINLFNRIYPSFDEEKLEKNWEWKDVDPLALFKPEDNRRRRRELFLLEYSPQVLPISESVPTQDQLAFKTILQKRFPGANILMTSRTIKLISPYTPNYDDLPDLPRTRKEKVDMRNVLEFTADLGLQWASAGGVNLYVYNGAILMSRYKSGYVSLADPYIDRPTDR